MPYLQYDAVREQAEKQLTQSQQALMQPMLTTYYALAGEDDLLGFAPEALFSVAYQNFLQLQHYDGGNDIQIYNPTLEKHGYSGEYSVIDIVTKDRPFLIDSIQMAFVRMNVSIQFVTHPLYRCEFDGEGKLTALHNATESNADNLSVIHIEFDKLPSEELQNVKAEIEHVLTQIELATDDWQAMGDKVDAVTKDIENTCGLPQTVEEVMETIKFLTWLKNKHFTFLGYREYAVKDGEMHTIAHSGLGVLRDDGQGKVSKSFANLPDNLKAKTLQPELLLFSKSNHLSVIHRPVYMDFIGIKTFDNQGNVIGEHRFLGLLTAEAYRLLPDEIPLLSHKMAQIIADADLPKNSHALKSFNNVLAQFPRDELFQASAEQIRTMALSVLHLRERDQLRFFARKGTFETYVACYVYVPKERYNTKLRRRFEDYLVKKLGGYDSEFSTHFSENVHVRVAILVRTKPGQIADFDPKAIEAELTPMMLDWSDETTRLLKEKDGRRAGNSLFKQFEKSIPAAYKDDFSSADAVDDWRYCNR